MTQPHTATPVPPLATALLLLSLLPCAACGGAPEPATGDDAAPADTAVSVDDPGPSDPAEAARWGRSPSTGDGSGRGTLVGVRSARHDGYDRFVLEFDGAVPGYAVRYAAEAPDECGSGRPVTVAAPFAFTIELEPAAAHDEDGNATVRDRDRTLRLPVLRSARVTCDFEGSVEWVLGLQREAQFRVFTLDGPPRLVVDFRHP